MNSNSALSKKTLTSGGIYINGNFSAKSDDRLNRNVSSDKSNSKKVISGNFFENDGENKNLVTRHVYTIKPGDNKRLTKDGVLKMYNIAEPVNIPVVALLGKWNKSHIGTTLVCINNMWAVKGGLIKIQKQENYISVALRQVLNFVTL